jgi:hypothetical protein
MMDKYQCASHRHRFQHCFHKFDTERIFGIQLDLAVHHTQGRQANACTDATDDEKGVGRLKRPNSQLTRLLKLVANIFCAYCSVIRAYETIITDIAHRSKITWAKYIHSCIAKFICSPFSQTQFEILSQKLKLAPLVH